MKPSQPLTVGSPSRLPVFSTDNYTALYNAFLAPGSPCELNIDHNLRQALASRMTRAIGDDDAMVKSLDEVAGLFDSAQNSVFKLMASVCPTLLSSHETGIYSIARILCPNSCASLSTPPCSVNVTLKALLVAQ